MRTYLASGTAACVLWMMAVACSGADPAPTNTTPVGGEDAGSPGTGSGSGGGTGSGSGAGTGSSGGSGSGSSSGGGTGSGSGSGGGTALDGGTTAPADGGAHATDSGGGTTSDVRVVGYIPNYNGSYADWAGKIDFSKMTHLNLAFASANGSNDWDMGASDSDVKALVDAAHASGVKVLASLGGGGGDQSVIAQYKDGNNVAPLVANLDSFLKRLNLDGADIDIEDGSNLGAAYSAFVSAVVGTLRPEGKLVTAAVAQYLQDSMDDATLHSFDFVNVMIYTNYSDSVSAMNYYTGTKSVPPKQLTIGAGFFGTDNGGNEYAYTDIIAADSSAWSKDQAQVKGQTVSYTGMASMKKIADYSKGFGGIMFWELTEDTMDEHSLYKVIQGEM